MKYLGVNHDALKAVCTDDTHIQDDSTSSDIRYPPSTNKIPGPYHWGKVVLADAGVHISHTITESYHYQFAKTPFNYGFAGAKKRGKSSIVNALRRLPNKHPLSAGASKTKFNECERFQFEDGVLARNVTLWELHYPKKMNAFFEFIETYELHNFTALFILIDRVPTDQDLIFAKIAIRRNATIVFLRSKCDKRLLSRSRAEEIPICDFLKERFVTKEMLRFDQALRSTASELCGRIHLFFVSAPVFMAMRCGQDASILLLHEWTVFEFLKHKRIIAEVIQSSSDSNHYDGSTYDSVYENYENRMESLMI